MWYSRLGLTLYHYNGVLEVCPFQTGATQLAPLYSSV